MPRSARVVSHALVFVCVGLILAFASVSGPTAASPKNGSSSRHPHRLANVMMKFVGVQPNSVPAFPGAYSSTHAGGTATFPPIAIVCQGGGCSNSWQLSLVGGLAPDMVPNFSPNPVMLGAPFVVSVASTVYDPVTTYWVSVHSQDSNGNSPANDPLIVGLLIKQPGSVTIKSADISHDNIQVVLEPSGTNGPLTITAHGKDPNNVTINQVIYSGSVNSNRVFHTSFHPTTLPIGVYSSLTATWKFQGGAKYQATASLSFDVLGLYHDTQYNVPAQSTCTGSPVAVTLWTTPGGTCTSTGGSYKSEFATQVYNNGTGIVSPGLYCNLEFECMLPGTPNPTNFRQPGSARSASCGTGLTNSTVAVAGNPSHSDNVLKCGDGIMEFTQNAPPGTPGIEKTVTDTCPSCSDPNTWSPPEVGHMDNFTTSNACSGIGDIGPYVTIRLR